MAKKSGKPKRSSPEEEGFISRRVRAMLPPPLIICPRCKTVLKISAKKLVCSTRDCEYNRELRLMARNSHMYFDLLDAVKKLEEYRRRR